MPVAPQCSLREPARKKMYEEITGAERSGCTSSLRPFGRVKSLTGIVTAAAGHGRPAASSTRRRSTERLGTASRFTR